jgi:OmcA/MtrC family decaheme c-type cytochrome
VDNGDGTYTFTFETDVTNVPDVSYEPTLTHRLAGQMGDRNVSIEALNWVMDFVPDGGELPLTRNIAVMETCNECHDDLVFHGRRFLVEYCVQCHNPDLTGGEGDMAYMTHRIHNEGTFTELDGGIDYSHVGYPQDVANCRKCHNEGTTADGDNWKNVPSLAACDGCHDTFAEGTHPAGPQPDRSCAGCHTPALIERNHTTDNATPNNPFVQAGQRVIAYELVDASVAANGAITINFKILSDGNPLDVTNLPDDMAEPGRYPSFLLAWALPQDGIDEPMDYNNQGRRGGQPPSVDLDGFAPLAGEESIGTMSYNAQTGVNTALITDEELMFPKGATLRAVGIQGYFYQDLTGNGEDDVSLHAPSQVVAITNDDVRRMVVDNDACFQCHEWFEGHGGSRVLNIEICTLCHLPNQSSSGRTVTNPDSRDLADDLQAAIDDETLSDEVDPYDPLTYPEDAQNLKDLIHGIHASAARTRPYQFVRGGRQGYYDLSHTTFPRGASTANCMLCHKEGTYELPLPADLLPTTVRTTNQSDGQDQDNDEVEGAFKNVPNETDWVNSPTSSSCFYCHTSDDAMNHMIQNGGVLSSPVGKWWNRENLFQEAESCSVCHGPGSAVDVAEVHMGD